MTDTSVARGTTAQSMTAADLVRDFKAGVSPVIVAEEALKKAEAAQTHTFLATTRDRALLAAAASERRYARGEPLGPLDGVPIAHKDIFDITGTKTTAGSATRVTAPIASQDAAAIALCDSAGAVCIGKTNLSEFAFSALGINPWAGTPTPPLDSSRVPGGSSSGSAIAVANRTVACAIGSDTSGSVRVPAAFNGLVGYRPTRDRYPRAGMLALAPTLDTVGLITNSVADAIALDRALAPAAPNGDSRGEGEIVIPDVGVAEQLSAAVAASFEEAVSRLSAAGFRIRHGHIDEIATAQAAMDHTGTIVAAEAFRRYAPLLGDPRGALVDPRIVDRLKRAAAISDSAYVGLLDLRRALRGRVAASLGGDFVLCPTVPFAAPQLAAVDDAEIFAEVNEATMRNTRLFSFLDMPAIALPAPATGGALATSIMLAAAPGADISLLALAAAAEPVVRGNTTAGSR